MMPPTTASSTRLKIEFAQASDPGRDPNKQINEDSCGYAETHFGHLCVLCDGMGGHWGGSEASRTAITTIFEVLEQTPASVAPRAALKAAIEEAGRRVYRLGGPPENRVRPGSTVVAMILHDQGADIAHVGDSRAYVIRVNQIYPLTRDHSMVQGMIDAGMITEAQAIGHPDANKITRALGMKPEVEVELRPEPMELYPGDVLILTSDGLTDLVRNPDILGCTRQALASGSVEHACKMLVQLANDRGGHDNVTVQMARVIEAGSRSLTIPHAPPGASSSTGSGAAIAQGAQETLDMTRPDEAAASQRTSAAAPLAHGHARGAPPPAGSPWGAIPPTTTDAGAGLRPTAIDAPAGLRPTAIDPVAAVLPAAADASAAVLPTATDASAAVLPTATDASAAVLPTATDASAAVLPTATDASAAAHPTAIDAAAEIGPTPPVATPLPHHGAPMPSAATPLPHHGAPMPPAATPLPHHGAPMPPAPAATPLPHHGAPMPPAATPLPHHGAPMPPAAAPLPHHAAPMQAAAAPMPPGAAPMPPAAAPMQHHGAPMPPAAAPLPHHRPPMPSPAAALQHASNALPHHGNPAQAGAAGQPANPAPALFGTLPETAPPHVRPMSPAFAAMPHNASGRDAAPALSSPLSMQAGSTVPSAARPSRGGLVFVVLGVAAVVTVMLVIVLWSVVTR